MCSDEFFLKHALARGIDYLVSKMDHIFCVILAEVCSIMVELVYGYRAAVINCGHLPDGPQARPNVYLILRSKYANRSIL